MKRDRWIFLILVHLCDLVSMKNKISTVYSAFVLNNFHVFYQNGCVVSDSTSR